MNFSEQWQIPKTHFRDTRDMNKCLRLVLQEVCSPCQWWVRDKSPMGGDRARIEAAQTGSNHLSKSNRGPASTLEWIILSSNKDSEENKEFQKEHVVSRSISSLLWDIVGRVIWLKVPLPELEKLVVSGMLHLRLLLSEDCCFVCYKEAQAQG